MKRILAMTLAFVLAFTLITPALAAEGTPPMEEPTVSDPVEEYIAAHPDEIAALDFDALLAGWGYKDPKIAFMEDYDFYSEVFEEAVTRCYVDNRVSALNTVLRAEEYKTTYPEAWASFDEDAWFEEEYGYYDQSREDVKASLNLLSDEELTADLFVRYVDAGLSYDYETGNDVWTNPYGSYEPEPEPTLTLVVNGKPVVQEGDGTFYAVNGVTYADADLLTSILGIPVSGDDNAVRAAAERAGWDVVWYDGGWRGVDRQVCLWDGETLKAHWAEEFGPAMDFLKDLLAYSEATLAREEGYEVKETITLDLTRFHTLDGDKTVSADIQMTEVFQDGVLDLTLEFNVLDFLNIFEAEELAALAKQGDFDLDSLKTFLKAGKIELLMDMKTYEVALRAPILALIAPDTFSDDWMGFRIPGAPDLTEEELAALPVTSSAALLDSLDIPQMLYDGLLQESEYQGGDVNTVELAEFCADFFGKDRFTHTGDAWTYTLTTKGVNEAVNDLLQTTAADSDVDFPHVELFKSCDLTYTVNTKTGAVDMKVDMRPNAKGLADLAWAEDDFSESAVLWAGLKAVFSAMDFQLTAEATGNGRTATETMTFHWVNAGELEMSAKMKMGKASEAPRKPSDVTEIPALYAPEADGSFDMGIIGGEDGPTSISITPAP